MKNFTNALAFIESFIHDEIQVVVTLNYYGKDYSQFQTLIVVWETFFYFQELIILFISVKMRIVDTLLNRWLKKCLLFKY